MLDKIKAEAGGPGAKEEAKEPEPVAEKKPVAEKTVEVKPDEPIEDLRNQLEALKKSQSTEKAEAQAARAGRVITAPANKQLHLPGVMHLRNE